MNASINQAAVALAQLVIQSEYSVRVTQLTTWSCVPVGYRGAATLESHGFYYSFWFDFTGSKVLVRIEGLGIFLAEWDDEEPPVVATVPTATVYQLPAPEALPLAA
jgi:hypothetical protein